MPVCAQPLQASSENMSNMEMGFTEQVWVSLNIIQGLLRLCLHNSATSSLGAD